MFSKELTIDMMKTICDFAEFQIEKIKRQCGDYIYTVNKLKEILNVDTTFDLINKTYQLKRDEKNWEKSIIYQLPDTDGNLSEVKVGQPVYRYKDKYPELEIIRLKNNKITVVGVINSNTFKEFTYDNITGRCCEEPPVYTNKPHRDFSDYPDWNRYKNNVKYWWITKRGYSFASKDKPMLSKLTWWGDNRDDSAGYRADVVNANGIVEDWEYSLVKRPEEK